MQTIHSTQVVTPFGSGYVPENHGVSPVPTKPTNPPCAKLVIVIAAALFAAAMAGAIAASSCASSPVSKLWLQTEPTILMKLPRPVALSNGGMA
jgi:hypothetical protein